jgi:hypothetical protein
VSPRNELKTLEIGLGGRNRLDFGTVRLRVQIPGPRPKSESALRNEAALKQDERSAEGLASHPVGILGSPVGSRKRIAKIIGLTRNLAVSKLEYGNTIHRSAVVVTDHPFLHRQLSKADDAARDEVHLCRVVDVKVPYLCLALDPLP